MALFIKMIIKRQNAKPTQSGNGSQQPQPKNPIKVAVTNQGSKGSKPKKWCIWLEMIKYLPF